MFRDNAICICVENLIYVRNKLRKLNSPFYYFCLLVRFTKINEYGVYTTPFVKDALLRVRIGHRT